MEPTCQTEYSVLRRRSAYLPLPNLYVHARQPVLTRVGKSSTGHLAIPRPTLAQAGCGIDSMGPIHGSTNQVNKIWKSRSESISGPTRRPKPGAGLRGERFWWSEDLRTSLHRRKYGV